MSFQPLAVSYIRFSTKAQENGDSYRRQYQLTQDYCKKTNLRLSDDEYLDAGLSAYTGKNKAEGRLGDLMVAIRSGKIPKGSYLIVESLDRISREKLMTQLGWFIDVLTCGINIVTLADGMVHKADGSGNFASILVALVTMQRANEESEIKSQRLKAAWKNKRKEASKKPLTGVLPHWLRLKKGIIEVIPERAELVREIFRDSLQGMGRRGIAKKLNSRSEPVWGSTKRNKSNLWNDSYIAKILMNRAVLGEYQPHTKREGKRHKEGPPLSDYYPRIVEDEVFYACQSRAKARRNKGGFAAPQARNLLTGIARCAICGGSMQFMDKGPPRSGRGSQPERFLRCRQSHMDSGKCTSAAVNYHVVERFVLAVFMSGLWNSIFRTKAEISDSGSQIVLREEEIVALDKKLAHLIGLVEQGMVSDAVISQITAHEARKGELRTEIDGMKAQTAAKASSLSTEKELEISRARGWKDDPPEIRLALKLALEERIESIYLQKRGTQSVGFFAVLRSGMFVVGTEAKNDVGWEHFDLVLSPWQLRTDEERIAIHYDFEDDGEDVMRPSPKEYNIAKGEDLVARCLSEEAASLMISLGHVPEKLPKFRKLNREEKMRLETQRREFRSLRPDDLRFDFNHKDSLPTALFLDGLAEGLEKKRGDRQISADLTVEEREAVMKAHAEEDDRFLKELGQPFDKRKIAATVEANYRSRL
jgi:DNA invertase Pin-like site-specific DNA recombinase